MADSAFDQGLTSGVQAPTSTPRHSPLVRVTHWIAALSFFALLVTGVEILISHPRFYWGEDGNSLMAPLFTIPIPASRASVPTGYGYVLPDQNGWSRSLHFQAAWCMVLAGLLYVIYGFASGHFRKNLAPAGADLELGTISRQIASHMRFERPGESEFWSYNVLQRLTYLCVIFVLFPLMIATGLAMSPAFTSAVPAVVTVFGGLQSARTIHFFGTLLFVLFLIIHVAMVYLAGFQRRMRAMTTSRSTLTNLPRRKLITTGAVAAAGASGLTAAAGIADRYGLIPPVTRGIYGPGETLTYASQRLITRYSRAREFSRDRISKTPFANGKPLQSAEYERLRGGEFAEWRLAVDGLVARPMSLSLADLKSYPSRSQITNFACEEGWSYIAEWTGVPLAHVLDLAGILPQARYVVYFSMERGGRRRDGDFRRQSIDMADALHPQTFLTYGMNGGELPIGHGGPLRLRVARQLGYKNLKYVNRITVTDSLKEFPAQGSYSWYAGI